MVQEYFEKTTDLSASALLRGICFLLKNSNPLAIPIALRTLSKLLPRLFRFIACKWRIPTGMEYNCGRIMSELARKSDSTSLQYLGQLLIPARPEMRLSALGSQALCEHLATNPVPMALMIFEQIIEHYQLDPRKSTNLFNVSQLQSRRD